ncbi:MFS transporter [Curvivirga aplysinae]|uniref:hypothetical protein n=1 Tax=Curvivirga aplysinae TaxID=2529852 RepID=UPI0012BD1E7A|nr:hypothetical protein [Curvivirga aplysinae]MTI10440.1 hypothetical protein [Curvivirga aplysinae]
MFSKVFDFFDDIVLELGRNFRWSYLPPLMVYFAAGVSGLTSIVGTFFIKEYLSLSAEFLAGLAFWAGLPWALKMPIGHLVDIIWRWKSYLVFLGASLMATSLIIMYMLISQTEMMAMIMSIEAWYILSALLSPIGYVLQDVVADAMTVEAVPAVDDNGNKFSDAIEKAMHTTMQTLGRVAIIGGVVCVSAINVYVFDDIDTLDEIEKVGIYASIYLGALAVPLISISGVILGGILLRQKAKKLAIKGVPSDVISDMLFKPEAQTKPNWMIFGGSFAFVLFTLFVGLNDVPAAQEMTFFVSISIILFLMTRLLKELEPSQAKMLIGTAIIIFIYRATPSSGAGSTWFEIDVLGFDQQFLSVLSFLTYGLTLAGLVVLRPIIVKRSIAEILVMLSIIGGIVSLPNIGLYYGIQEWTSALTNGVVDARFIAIFDTALESPLGQIAMIPMLAWIARNAPVHLKATFFAVMASFTNLALSASNLMTKYMNQIYTVTREVKDRATGEITIQADYSELGMLLITVAVIIVVVPVFAVMVIQATPLRTTQ